MKCPWIAHLLAAALLPQLVLAKSSEVFGTACSNQASLYDFGCKIPAPGKLAKKPNCLCNTPAYVETVIGCVADATKSSMKRGKAVKTIKALCVNGTVDYDYVALMKNYTSLPVLTEEETKGLHKSAFRMPQSDIDIGLDIMNQKASDRFKDDRYLAAPLSFFALVFLIKSVANLLAKTAPKVYQRVDSPFIRRFRKNVFLPATGSYHHSEPRAIGSFTFNIPTRIETLIMVGYFVVNVFMLFLNHDVYDPNFNTPKTSAQFGDELGNRSGMIMISEMMIMFLFAGRNNLLRWLTGWPADTFTVFHKWVARTFVFNVLVHTIAMTIEFSANHSYSEGFERGYYRWGVVATILTCLLVVFSAHYFRSMGYEIFLAFHITLTAVTLAAIWFHLAHPQEGYPYLYTSIAIWGFDRVMRIVRVVWSGVASKAEISLKGDGNVIEFKIDYSKRWKPYAGSYAYFHILRPSHFWQSHPFSIITSSKPEDEGKIILMTRVKDGVTKSTRDYLLKQPGNTARLRVLLDGPYGAQYPLHQYETMVLIAGGIGITGVYQYANELRQNPDRNQRCVVVWCVADEHPLSWFGEQIEYLISDPRFDVQIHVVNGSSTSSVDIPSDGEEKEKEPEEIMSSGIDRKWGRPDLQSLVAHQMSEATGSVAFLSCGPGAMNDDVRQAVAGNVVKATARVDYYEESFSW